jgi:hypothetical protein
VYHQASKARCFMEKEEKEQANNKRPMQAKQHQAEENPSLL